MPLRKTAIAVPEDVLTEVDAAAKEAGESRSAFITRVLRRVVESRRDADITRRLDAVFAGDEARQEQLRMTAELDASGSSWNDERW